MDNPGYITLSRQSGLMKELRVIANNIANAGTTGFKREAAVFSEYVDGLNGTDPSLSIGRLGAHYSDLSQGGLHKTGASLDMAIDGQGFFLVETAQGQQLTRAGHGLINQEGILVDANGFPFLDGAGGQIQFPTGSTDIVIARDGTISVQGEPLGKIGIVTAQSDTLKRTGNNLWQATQGYEVELESNIAQGYLEESNVQPVIEMARLIEVQRSYEMGMKVFEDEDERISQVIREVGLNR